MTEITVLTGVDTFVLDNDAAMDLLDHIRSAGGQNREAAEAPLLAAIESQGTEGVRWSDDGKHGAVHAINAWLISDGTGGMPEVIIDIRNDLMRDLGLPPFDEEIPYDPT